ncbi:MAG: 2-oxoglutarate dehydrogenase E1 component [Desulfobacterales bacterium]|nr:2-oxoglutarate dehydrogenase E1 component [Desulfobacterales bacterium]
MSSFVAPNLDYIETQYSLWKSDPSRLSPDWRFFFEGFDLGASGRLQELGDSTRMPRQARVHSMVSRFREIGHLLACLDPLEACPTEHPLLSLEAFGLELEDLERTFVVPDGAPNLKAPLKEILAGLRETYCRSIGVEFMHLQDPAERRWLIERMEPVRNRPVLDPARRRRILEKLIQSSVFEQFLNTKYVGVTRFSLEGGDALIPGLDALLERAAALGGREIILGMAHRGRLNVQVNILAKPFSDVFSEFENCYDPDNLVGAGDVKYHTGYLNDIQPFGGRTLRVVMMNNPSHLEAVDPVVEGFARARQELAGDPSGRQVLPLLIHGDAAFAGQGVVAETLNLSQLAGYKTGGTVHVIINNQIGYTTLPEHARSTRYSTDIAKMLMVPVIHVHGEDPEAVAHVMQLAADYRWEFGKDVVVDLVCFRRYGHNEGDEPYFTQPLMYARIRERPALERLYAAALIDQGLIAAADADRTAEELRARLSADYDAIHGSVCVFPEQRTYENWAPYSGVYSPVSADTGVSRDTLLALARRLNTVPEGFRLNPKLEKLLARRREAVATGTGIDWANAEALALASLLAEGHPVRLSGQDSGRGTFSQRHSVLFDTENGAAFTPLNRAAEGQAPFAVWDSPLSEAGVLGFEYGYSLARPEGLTVWEAQFGDFANNAQAVIDLFIASGEAKWQRLSGLTLLLPHGMEGLGPEHSSARLERFLQLCAGENLQVCQPTTPAQYFHLLRRQALAGYRKPLVVMTPKSLLRHPAAVAAIEELAKGSFRGVKEDPAADPAAATVLFCSGKVAYELMQRRSDLQRTDIAILRLEQLYPFPQSHLKFALKRFKAVTRWVWVQDEPENMGAWQFIRPRIEAATGKPLAFIGRPESASPATGFPHIYRRWQAEIIDRAVGPKS